MSRIRSVGHYAMDRPTVAAPPACRKCQTGDDEVGPVQDAVTETPRVTRESPRESSDSGLAEHDP